MCTAMVCSCLQDGCGKSSEEVGSTPNMVPLRGMQTDRIPSLGLSRLTHCSGLANPPLPRGIEIRTPPPVRPLSHPLPQPQYQPSPAPVPGLFSPRLDDGIDLDIDLDWDLSLAFDPNSAREVSGPPPVLSSGESFALYYSTPILGDAFVLDDTGPSTQLQPRILDVIRSPIVDSFITFENLRVEFRLILETTPFYCLDLKYDSNGMPRLVLFYNLPLSLGFVQELNMYLNKAWLS